MRTAVLVLYTCTMMLGISSEFLRVRFGRLHHVMYFLTFAVAAVCAVTSFHWALILVIAVLALLPVTRGRTWEHRVLGAAGFFAAILAAIYSP
ncbi:MAG: hypothetical protein HY042_03410 [Spirochaetia bacterium]|nr:hypothetical protein [Spirochaetia bacterium]